MSGIDQAARALSNPGRAVEKLALKVILDYLNNYSLTSKPPFQFLISNDLPLTAAMPLGEGR